jgi:hypothetical protein
MKYGTFFTGLLILTSMFSCTRSADPAAPVSLDGKWKMISVKDHNTGVTSVKPANEQRDVEFTITSTSITNGHFKGHTLVNQVEGDFTLGNGSSISIPSFSTTDVYEGSWGRLFLNNLISSRYYNINAQNILNIITVNKTLTFQKL